MKNRKHCTPLERSYMDICQMLLANNAEIYVILYS